MNTENIDWSKCVIYKIISKDSNCDYLYIGSTIDFNRRFKEHKRKYNNEKSKKYNFKLYKFIRENGGFDNFEMIIIENFTECKNKLELRQREQYWIDELNSKLNTQKAANFFLLIEKNLLDCPTRKKSIKVYKTQ